MERKFVQCCETKVVADACNASYALGTWNIDRIFIPPCVSCDTCPMSCVSCHVSGVRSVVTCHVSHVTSNSITIRAWELKFWEQVHLLPPVTCHLSCVTCHTSYVTCCMSHFFFYKVVKLVVGGSVINKSDPVQFLEESDTFFFFLHFWGTSKLCIGGDLIRQGLVTLGVGDMWQLTGDWWQVTGDRWQVTVLPIKSLVYTFLN